MVDVVPKPVGPADTRPPSAPARRPTHALRRRWPTWLLVACGGLGLLAGFLLGTSATSQSGGSDLPTPAANTAPGTVTSPDVGMPDPFIMPTSSVDYLYTSGLGYHAPNIPVRSFTKWGQWSPVHDAMPTLPGWATPWVWTPDVRQVGPNAYVMWYTAVDHDLHMSNGVSPKCIGEATASSPTGPFVPLQHPTVCNTWGSIDPRTFLDADGQLWLVWKADNNADPAGGVPCVIWSQRLDPDGTTLSGPRYPILTSRQPWENGLIEAPDLVLHDGQYYLFFSGNNSLKTSNGIGMAVCSGPAGPCSDLYGGPFLGSNPQGTGPGEESLFQQNGQTWLLYSPHAIFGLLFVRPIAYAAIDFAHGRPYIAQPTATPGP